jgi:hypothetical protein
MPLTFMYEITDTFENVEITCFHQKLFTDYVNNLIERDGFLPTDREQPRKFAMTRKVTDATIRCFFHRNALNDSAAERGEPEKYKLRLSRRFVVSKRRIAHEDYGYINSNTL